MPRSARLTSRGLVLAWLALMVVPLGVPRDVLGQKFDSRGRIDPFVNLREMLRKKGAADKSVGGPPPIGARNKVGLEGLLITEVNLTGIMVGKENRIALLRGQDNFTYLAKPGARLYDGYVAKINASDVVFVREVVDPRGNKQVTRVVQSVER